jgi:RNA polymerase sigma factor (sigma-70 family)
MIAPDLDASFAAFRRGGDPQHLAAVFDATAPELLRVAHHLAPDAHFAEDLVQTTFLVAIENRHRYDPELPVLPWLLGILANTARNERRRARRPLPSAPNALPVEAPTVDVAAADERSARLQDALRALPEPYRQVLLLQVDHGLDSGQIAEVTGRKPGTVRTQIARGMDLLRGALPLGAATVLAATSAPAAASLALLAMRSVVLQRAGDVAGAASVATATSVYGGLVMKKVLTTAFVVVLLAAGIGWWQANMGDVAVPPPTPPAVASMPAARAAATGPASGAAGQNSTDATDPQRASLATPTTASLRIAMRHADGRAAAEVGVYLTSTSLPATGREAATDAGGSVIFPDLRPGPLTIKPDRGPATACTLVPGANDLELTLPLAIDIEGRVTDPDAKVAVPHATIFAVSREHHDRAQRLGQADGEGRFQLRSVPIGARLFARAAGWQPGDPGRANASSPQPLTLRLGARAHSLRGRVTRPDGTPSAHAMVAILVDEDSRKSIDGLRARKDGMARQRDVDAQLIRTDANGDYQSDEVPEGEALVFVRPTADQPPEVALVTATVAAGSQNRRDVVLAAGATVFGIVRDDAGRPFAGVPILAKWRGTDETRFEGAFGDLVAAVTTVTATDGSYRLTGLLAGDHEVRPRTTFDADLNMQRRGDAVSRLTVDGSEQHQLDFVVPRTGDQTVRLIGADGAPLAGWGIWLDLDPAPTPRTARLEAQRTDAEGITLVPDLPLDRALHAMVFAPRPPAAGDRSIDRFPARQWTDVWVRDRQLVLQLGAGDVPNSSLRGRFVDRHGAPAAKACEFRREAWSEVRRLELADGMFAEDALPAGRYFLLPNAAGSPCFGPYEVLPGQHLELGELVIATPGSLRVTLRADDGGAIEAPDAELHGPHGRSNSLVLDAATGELVARQRAPGRYRLWICADNLAPSGHDIEIRAGEETRREITLPRGFRQRFEVVPNGVVKPARDGWLVDTVVFEGSEHRLTHGGRRSSLTFDLPMSKGTWTIHWNLPDQPRSSHTFQLGDQPSPTIVLRTQ